MSTITPNLPPVQQTPQLQDNPEKAVQVIQAVAKEFTKKPLVNLVMNKVFRTSTSPGQAIDLTHAWVQELHFLNKPFTCNSVEKTACVEYVACIIANTFQFKNNLGFEVSFKSGVLSARTRHVSKRLLLRYATSIVDEIKTASAKTLAVIVAKYNKSLEFRTLLRKTYDAFISLPADQKTLLRKYLFSESKERKLDGIHPTSIEILSKVGVISTLSNLDPLREAVRNEFTICLSEVM